MPQARLCIAGHARCAMCCTCTLIMSTCFGAPRAPRRQNLKRIDSQYTCLPTRGAGGSAPASSAPVPLWIDSMQGGRSERRGRRSAHVLRRCRLYSRLRCRRQARGSRPLSRLAVRPCRALRRRARAERVARVGNPQRRGIRKPRRRVADARWLPKQLAQRRLHTRRLQSAAELLFSQSGIASHSRWCLGPGVGVARGREAGR